MLKTNGGVSARELYSDSFLSTVTAIINMAQSVAPMGIAMVTMRTRFAGLHRPESSIGPRDMLEKSSSVLKKDEEEPVKQPQGSDSSDEISQL